MEAEYINMVAKREIMYGFLAGLCLRPPAEDLMVMIRDGSILEFMSSNEDSRGYSELKKFVEECSGIDDMENAFAGEHAALFDLPSGVMPHESVFLDRDQRLGGRLTIEVLEFYKWAGAEIKGESVDMPDHVGMELEFMQFLCRLESEAWNSADLEVLTRCVEFQHKFLDEHLLNWIFQCCDRIVEKASMHFYKALAYLMMDFMKEEETYVAELNAVLKNGECGLCKTNA